MIMLPIEKINLYVPYGIHFRVDGKVVELDYIKLSGYCVFKNIIESNYGHSHIQPILKPIWEADTYIRSQFSRFDNGLASDKEVIDLFCFDSINTDELLCEISLENLTHKSFMWLVKNKYDVFGWIESGEAVDYNDCVTIGDSYKTASMSINIMQLSRNCEHYNSESCSCIGEYCGYGS